MGKHLLAGLIVVMVGSACSSTFLVTKNGYGYFLGSKSDAAYQLLCETGDLKKVLSETSFTGDMQADMYRYNCIERSSERVKQIYASLSATQRKDLRSAFRKNGFDINYLPC